MNWLHPFGYFALVLIGCLIVWLCLRDWGVNPQPQPKPNKLQCICQSPMKLVAPPEMPIGWSDQCWVCGGEIMPDVKPSGVSAAQKVRAGRTTGKRGAQPSDGAMNAPEFPPHDFPLMNVSHAATTLYSKAQPTGVDLKPAKRPKSKASRTAKAKKQ